MNSPLQRNATWMAERVIGQMAPNERAAFEVERGTEGWAATLKQRLQDWPTNYMGPRPKVAEVIEAMERIAFPLQHVRPYVTMPTLTTRDSLSGAGYVAHLLVGRKDGVEVSSAEYNAINVLLQEGLVK